MNRTDLAALLSAVPLPALVVDRARRVVLANSAAEALLGSQLAGGKFATALRHPDALRCIDEAIRTAASASADIVMPVPVRRTYNIGAVFFSARDGADDFVLFTMRDVTYLIEAEQARSSFVANVSHELRSPLAVLTGAIETLLGPAADDGEAQHKFLHLMRAEAQRMNRLIDDLLSLSMVEVREHVRPGGEIDLADLVKSTVAAMAVRHNAAEANLEVSTQEGLPAIPGDRDELTQVVQNLIDNAIKYGDPGQPIDISVRAAPKVAGMQNPCLVVSVRDHGPGIAAEHLPRLTERFYRVDPARLSKQGGTGLGLAITKHIVNRHRGRLTIDSTPGGGSTFAVYLPCA